MPSQQEMMADLQAADAAGDTQLAQHIAGLIKAAQNPNGAVAGERDLGPVGNSVLAGAIHAVHQIPFLGDAGLTLGRAIGDTERGQGFDWSRANAETQQQVQSAQQLHPVASTVGGTVGGVASALLGGEALKGVQGLRGARATLALRSGAPIANTARLAATGAIAGGVQGAAQAGGQEAAAGNFGAVPGAALAGGTSGALTGAVAGPVGGMVGRAVGAVAGRVAPGSVAARLSPGKGLDGKAAMALSKVFNENPGDLQTAWQSFQQETGRAPSMAELATLKQQNLILGAAKDSAPITLALRGAADSSAQARAATMRAGVAPTATSSGELSNAKTAQGDTDYTASRAAPDFNISTEEDPALGGVSPADHLSSEILPQAGLGRADRVRIQNGLQNGALSSQDAQLIHSGLSSSLSRSYSPSTKGYITDLEGMLSAPGNEAPAAALDTARANYAANAQREAGAAHGESILGSDSAPNFIAEATSKANNTPEFAQGVQAGAASAISKAAATPQGAASLSQRLGIDADLHGKLAHVLGPDAADGLKQYGVREAAASDALAPYASRLGPTEDNSPSAAGAVLQGVSTVASHGGWAAVHGLRAALGAAKIGMAPAVQEKVAEYLSNPAMVQQGLNLMRRAGMSNEAVQQFATTLAGSAGGGVGSNVGGDQ